MKKFSRRAAERINREIPRDDDGNRIKNGPVHVARGRQNHFRKVVLLPSAKTQFAVDVLHHHDGAVDDDSEINRADGKQIGGFAREVQKNEGEKQSKRNRKSRDDRCGVLTKKKMSTRRINAIPRRRLPSTVSVVTRTRSLRS